MSDCRGFESSADSGPIDNAVLQELRLLCMTQQDFSELIDIYLQDLAAKLTLLAAAIPAHDVSTICSISHTMSSSSMSLGALQLGALFRDLNAAAKDQQQASLATYLDAISEMHGKVERALRMAANTAN